MSSKKRAHEEVDVKAESNKKALLECPECHTQCSLMQPLQDCDDCKKLCCASCLKTAGGSRHICRDCFRKWWNDPVQVRAREGHGLGLTCICTGCKTAVRDLYVGPCGVCHASVCDVCVYRARGGKYCPRCFCEEMGRTVRGLMLRHRPEAAADAALVDDSDGEEKKESTEEKVALGEDKESKEAKKALPAPEAKKAEAKEAKGEKKREPEPDLPDLAALHEAAWKEDGCERFARSYVYSNLARKEWRNVIAPIAAATPQQHILVRTSRSKRLYLVNADTLRKTFFPADLLRFVLSGSYDLKEEGPDVKYPKSHCFRQPASPEDAWKFFASSGELIDGESVLSDLLPVSVLLHTNKPASSDDEDEETGEDEDEDEEDL